jgi:hypothetical protein
MIAEEATEGESRKSDRVTFERGVDVYMMAIDGTWRRDCIMKEASDSGAKLLVRGSIEGLNLKEFFLLLSSTGLAYRRCQLSWVNGDQIGANFTKRVVKKNSVDRSQGRDVKIFRRAPSRPRHRIRPNQF